MAQYENEEISGGAFRTAFKFYKNKEKPLDFSRVVDVDKLEPKKFVNSTNFDKFRENFGSVHLKNPENWRIYTFAEKPGLILARDIFTTRGNYFWPEKCLKNYSAYPNVSNISEQLNSLTDFNGNILKYPKLLKKLRWITLGYHHDWNTKKYSEEKRTEMPAEMKILAKMAAFGLGYGDFYSAEATIVNFYHLNSTLAGHVDRSEKNMDPPLLSFSFGQSAIFLLGSTNLDDEPTPIYLRNGDLVAMSENVRLAYHAVPRIVSDFRLAPSDYEENETDLRVFEYLNENRINLNIRQVN